MSLIKVIGIIILVSIVLLGIMLYLAIAPTTRNVSDKLPLKPFLGKTLKTKREAVIYACDETEQRFESHLLSENLSYPCEKKYNVEVGTPLVIREFRSYKNGVSGFTYLYALAEVRLSNNKLIFVEYNWGSTDLAQLSNNLPELPRAIWQNDHDRLILLY